MHNKRHTRDGKYGRHYPPQGKSYHPESNRKSLAQHQESLKRLSNYHSRKSYQKNSRDHEFNIVFNLIQKREVRKDREKKAKRQNLFNFSENRPTFRDIFLL